MSYSTITSYNGYGADDPAPSAGAIEGTLFLAAPVGIGAGLGYAIGGKKGAWIGAAVGAGIDLLLVALVAKAVSDVAKAADTIAAPPPSTSPASTSP